MSQLEFPTTTQKKIGVIQYVPVWLPPTQIWIYNLIKHLPEHLNSAIFCEAATNLDEFSVPLLHLFSEAGWWERTWDRTLRWLSWRDHLGWLVRESQRKNFQILHSHFGNVGWQNREAASQCGLKHVVTFYGQDVNRLPRLDPRWYGRYQELFRKADLFLCEGPHMQKCLIEMGCPAEKVRVHHLGANIGNIHYQPRHWNPGTELKVLIAAAFREKKGIPLALNALGQLKRKTPLQITIIGDTTADPASQSEKKRILEELQAARLSEFTRLLGFQPYSVLMKEAYQHHLFLSPSLTSTDGDTEGGAPVSLIDMAASGMPIISSTHCDIPEIILHGQTGRLAREGSVEDLVCQLEWMMENPSAWEEMLWKGRQHMEREFNVGIQASKLAQIYEGIVRG